MQMNGRHQDVLDVDATNMSSQVFTARRTGCGSCFCLISGALTLSAKGVWLLIEGVSDICGYVLPGL